MSRLLPGVEPIGTDGHLQGVTTVKHDTTDTKAPRLQVEHSYHTEAKFVREENHHAVIAGYIQLKNISPETTLSDISVYIDLDDTGSSVDAYICDQEGGNLELQGDYKISFDHPLTPGQTSVRKRYYWSLVHRGAPIIHQTKNFTVTPNISPMFTVRYMDGAMFSSDVTSVDVPTPQ